MLYHPLPQPYGPRSHRYPKLGPHTGSVRRMLQENATLPPSARLSIEDIYNRIRDKEGFRRSYGSVKDYVRLIPPDKSCIWEYAYDLLTSLEKKRAIDFLFLLSRADPPVISRSRTERFFRDAGGVISIAPKPDKREQARQAASSGCAASSRRRSTPTHFVGRSAISPTLRPCLTACTTAACPTVIDPWPFSRARRGLSRDTVCGFLGIDKHTYRKYLRTFESGGHAALSRVRPNPRGNTTTRRSSKRFLATDEPPSNYGINGRPGSCATWLGFCGRGTTGLPQCDPHDHQGRGLQVAQGKIVLTSNDPTYIEKVARIRSILSSLQPDEAFFSITKTVPLQSKQSPDVLWCRPGSNRRSRSGRSRAAA